MKIILAALEFSELSDLSNNHLIKVISILNSAIWSVSLFFLADIYKCIKKHKILPKSIRLYQSSMQIRPQVHMCL